MSDKSNEPIDWVALRREELDAAEAMFLESGMDKDLEQCRQSYSRFMISRRGKRRKATEPDNEKFASVAWTVSDLKDAWEQDNLTKATDAQARDWWTRNQKYLRDRLVEHGFDVLSTLLTMDPLVKTKRRKG